MTIKVTEHARRKILDAETPPLIRDGKLIFHAIRLQQVGGEMRVEFINGSTLVGYMMSAMPAFSAGETLTLAGIDGGVAVCLEVI
jgi:hypothetical protein